jgi:hypothetical protein
MRHVPVFAVIAVLSCPLVATASPRIIPQPALQPLGVKWLDWLLDLPREMEQQLWQEIARSQEEKTMAFVTFAEQYGMEKGQRLGLLKGLALALDLKFGEAGSALMPELEGQEKLATLDAVYAAVKSANSVEDLRKLLPAAPTADGNEATS